MAPAKKRAKATQKLAKKRSLALWLIPLFSAIAFPSVFLLLKKEIPSDVEETSEPTASFAEEVDQSVTVISTGLSLPYEELLTMNQETLQGISDVQVTAPEPSSSYSEELKSSLQIGGDYTYVTIKPGSQDAFTGNLGGAQASYEYRPSNFFYGALTFDWKEGTTGSGSNTRSLLFFDVQEKGGYTFSPKNVELFISLFSGFGYRYLGQTLSQPGESSLDFGYNEFYIPVGFISSYELNSFVSLGANFSWMPQVFSTVSIDPLKGANWKLTNTLANLHAEIPLTFTFNSKKNVQLLIKPFYEYWQDGHSTAKLSSGIALGLPGNIYNFYGVNVNLGYSF